MAPAPPAACVQRATPPYDRIRASQLSMVLKNASEYAPTFPSKYKNDELQLISGKTFSKEDNHIKCKPFK